jgi:hypothetical protein
MSVRLQVPAGVPVIPWLYLQDARDRPDPPERHPGQFGNMGFRTTGWEHIDAGVHHLKLSVCLEAAGQASGE